MVATGSFASLLLLGTTLLCVAGLATADTVGSITQKPWGLLSDPGTSTHPADESHMFASDPHHRILLTSISRFGRCTFPSVTLTVKTEADFAKRVAISNNTLVILMVQNNIQLSQRLVFGGNFSCTVMKAASAKGVVLGYDGYDQPAFIVQYASNVLIYNVSFTLPGTIADYQLKPTDKLPPLCNFTIEEKRNRSKCATVIMYQSYNVQLTQAAIHGRVDIVRSAACVVDSNYFTSYGDARYLPAAVRVLASGDPASLLRSSNKITNNHIDGFLEVGILLQQQAIGVVVANNHIRNFTFTGVQVGCCFSTAGDAMLNQVVNNHIEFVQNGYKYNNDSGGIYMDLKWTNPGNYLSCNYIYEGAACVYWDVASSGTTVNGGVCINTGTAIKVNYGKANLVTSLIKHKGSTRTSFLTCFGVCHYQCNERQWWQDKDQPTTKFWIPALYGKFSTPAWQSSFPWTVNVCNFTSILGVPCNPTGTTMPAKCKAPAFCSKQDNQIYPYNVTNGILDTTEGKPTATAAQTGKCSGLPYLNYISMIGVDGVNKDFLDDACCGMPAVPRMNFQQTVNIKNATAGFDNIAEGDYGASNPSAGIYQLYPGFKSCPKASVGVQTSDHVTALVGYAKNFNRRVNVAAFQRIARSAIDLSETVIGRCKSPSTKINV